MEMAPDPHTPETQTEHEQLVEQLRPESEQEERLVRQMALCRVKLTHLEELVAKAESQLRQALTSVQDEPSP